MDVCKELWTADLPKFSGKYVKFDDVLFTPKPVQNPIPIWVGGESGPALRRTVSVRRSLQYLPGFDFDHPPGSWIAPTEHDLKRP
jgi:Luciferase-like monooxygenase